MTETVIADASCLIVLANIGELDLLRRTFGRVTITPAVQEEYGSAIAEWMQVRSPRTTSGMKDLLEELGRGEATSIALATEISDHLLVLDDKAARRIAIDRGLRYVGTLGVLTLAKRRGAIDLAGPYLARM